MPDQRRNPRNAPPRRPARPPAGRSQATRGTRTTVGWSPRFLLLSALLLIAVVVALLVGVFNGSSNSINKNQRAVDYTLPNGTKVYGSLGPEGVPLEQGSPLASPNAGLTGATIDGIQCLAREQLVYHHHIHLSIFVNGKPFSVPLGTGMVAPVIVQNTTVGEFAEGSQSCLYWLHVHAQDGIVHIESPEVRNFELGQFFDIWHVPLSSTEIGTNQGTVAATVNGQPWTDDPTAIPLTEHAQIVLNVGTPVVTPPPISWRGTQL